MRGRKQIILLIATIVFPIVAFSEIEVTSIGQDSKLDKIQHALDALKSAKIFEHLEAQQLEIQRLVGRVEELEAKLSSDPESSKIVSQVFIKKRELFNTIETTTPDIKTSRSLYQKAYNFLLQKKYALARKEFQHYITDNPNSKYIPNSYYWLGELYILDKQFFKAKIVLNKLINKYPHHVKSFDAQLKLAYLYHDLGNNDKAIYTLQKIINGNVNSSLKKLAKVKMKEILEKEGGK